jgi:hypothetical protein
MTVQRGSVNWRREELLSLLSTSGALAGLCITIVALMNGLDKTRADVSIVDDVLAVCAGAFLLCIYLIFWALRSHKSALSAVLMKVVDGVFLFAMTAMTCSAFMMIYTLW